MDTLDANEWGDRGGRVRRFEVGNRDLLGLQTLAIAGRCDGECYLLAIAGAIAGSVHDGDWWVIVRDE